MEANVLDFTEKNGLVFCANPVSLENNYEILYINEAKKLGIDAVLFRRYYIETEKISYKSEPSVCVLVKNDGFFDSAEHIKLHAAIWSAGKNEVYVIKGETRIDIINARKPAESNHENNLSIESLVLASSRAINGIQEELFSAKLFGSGTFWDQPQFEEKIDERNSPYIFLLDYLMTVRKLLLADGSLNLLPETIDKLLVTCILVKFLEEIKDDQGKHTLRLLYKKYKINNFAEAVDNKLVIDILNDLANEFNGRIFDKFDSLEKNLISSSDLSLLAHFLRANIDIKSGQLFFWEQYSFKHLPTEIISAIYENFIQAEAIRQNGDSEKGVVYTPIHLVNLLIDEVMPLDKPHLFNDGNFKVLDPTCGSGVFLVAAYKRLLQWWAITNSTKDEIVYPSSKVAQRILEENIFGIDVKKTATLVTIFGLTTALLDKLTPQEIWNNLRFKDLSQKNIQNDNFFEWALTAKEQKLSFDLIIGNPPFNIETGKNKEDVLAPSVIKKLDFFNKKIPNNNFALHFLEGSCLFGKKICLIIPSNVLLYNKAAHSYRRSLFSNFTVEKIYDFTHLREVLFTKKSNSNYDDKKKIGRTPVAALIINNVKPIGTPIQHVVVKRTTEAEKKIRFEIDYYDQQQVKLDWALDPSKSFIWKTNLLGGGRLFHLIYKLSLLPTLKNHFEDLKRQNEEWLYSSGYKIGGNESTKSFALHLHQKPSISTKIKFDESQNCFTTTIEAEKKFEAPRNELLFSPPVLVVAEILGKKKIPMQLFNAYQTFNISFIGIHAPLNEFDKLNDIYNRLYVNDDISKINRLYMLLTSSKLLIHKETAFIKEDFDSLPYPQQIEDLDLSIEEKLIQEDILKYYVHLGKAISSRSAGNIFVSPVSDNQLTSFGKVFCASLNKLYKKNGNSWQLGCQKSTNQFVYLQFGFGPDGGLNNAALNGEPKDLEVLVNDNITNSGLINKRILRIYQHVDGYDCIIFVKPVAQRYWLDSIALKDVDDTFMDFKKAGF